MSIYVYVDITWYKFVPKQVWPARKTLKNCAKWWRGCRKTLPQQTLAWFCHCFSNIDLQTHGFLEAPAPCISPWNLEAWCKCSLNYSNECICIYIYIRIYIQEDWISKPLKLRVFLLDLRRIFFRWRDLSVIPYPGDPPPYDQNGSWINNPFCSQV
jgi:hypothetical protein